MATRRSIVHNGAFVNSVNPKWIWVEKRYNVKLRHELKRVISPVVCTLKVNMSEIDMNVLKQQCVESPGSKRNGFEN